MASSPSVDLSSWPLARLHALIGCIREVTPLQADGFSLASTFDEAPFWSNAAAVCDLPKGEELAKGIAEAVQASLEVVDVSRIRSDVFVGDMSTAESRLAVHHLGIKGIIVLGDQLVPRWEEDGVQYLLVPRCSLELDELVQPRLEECVRFFTAHAPILVCSQSGTGSTALVAAACLAACSPQPLDAQTAIKQVEAKRGPCHVEMDDMEKMADFLSSPCRTPPVTPPARLNLQPPPPPTFRLGEGGVPLLPSAKRQSDAPMGPAAEEESFPSPKAKVAKPLTSVVASRSHEKADADSIVCAEMVEALDVEG